MDAYRISLNDKRATGIAQTHKSIGLLEPTKQQAQQNTYQCATGRNKPSLEKEDAPYLLVRSSELAQGLHVVFLVYHQHRERTDDIEARHDEDERKKGVGKEFLHLHHLERVGLLLVAV